MRDVYRGPNREALVGGPLPDDGRPWESFVHPDDRALWRAAVERLPAGEPLALEYRVVGLDGAERIVLDHLRPRREPHGALLYDGVTRDITERRRLEDELRSARAEAERRARTDELTGAYNRRHFAEIVAEALADDPRGCGLLLLDADHFKQVNDLHGHVVGDAVLVELARRLRPASARATAWPAGAGRSSPCCSAASARTPSSTGARSGCAPPWRARRSPSTTSVFG